MGRIFIDEDIINAPRKLKNDEMQEIRKLPLISSKIFENVNFFSNIIPLITHHKEHYDGTGYPSKLSGDEIPLGSRIIALAEAYIAMTSQRPFRKPLNTRQAIQEILESSGNQFDPEVVEAFIKILINKNPELRSELEEISSTRL